MKRFLVSLIGAILAGSAFLAMASTAEAVCRGDCGYWPGYYAYAPGYNAPGYNAPGYTPGYNAPGYTPGYNAPGNNYPYAPAYNYAPRENYAPGQY